MAFSLLFLCQSDVCYSSHRRKYSVFCEMYELVHKWSPSLIHAVTFPLPPLPPSSCLHYFEKVCGWVQWGRISEVAQQAWKWDVFPCRIFFLTNVMKPTTLHSISRKMWILLLCYEKEQWRQSSSDLSKIAKGIWLKARTSSTFSSSCLHGKISPLCLTFSSFLKFLTIWNGY